MKSSLPRRRLIPRWRPVSKTLETSEVESILNRPTKKLAFDRDLFDDAVEAWKENPTVGHLGDVVAFSPDEELMPAIRAVVDEAMSHGHAVSEPQRAISLGPSEKPVDPDDTHLTGKLAIQARVATLRQQLIVAPDNVMALLDLAQLQLAAGKRTTAERLLKTAMNIVPNGRIVLRTAARFFVHLGEYERAHSLIVRHPASKEDPWLIASEIALAEVAGRSSALIKVGQRMLRTSGRSSRQLAELAGAVASSELREGSLKEARRLFRFALEQPTDNVVAQALVEAQAMGVKLDEPVIEKAVTHSSEAQLIQSWMAADERASEMHALKWHAEEPFSSRPLQFITTLYALQGAYDKALEWVQMGLIADPSDPGLTTNLSFAQAAAGHLEAAEVSVKRGRALGIGDLEPYLVATEGLIALRRHQFDLAKTHYRDAEQRFLKSGQDMTAALCVAHYAKFATESGSPDSVVLLKEAQERVTRKPTIDGLIMLGRMANEPVQIPAGEEDQRRLSQWVFDPVKNTLIQKVGVTAKGAPAIIFQPSKPSTDQGG